jgi:uncharacterized protein (DUF1015 family)
MFKPRHGLRPKKEYAKEVCCLPYDVMDSQEAYEMARDNPHSFLHIIRSEIDLDASVGAYSDAVYEKAAENLSAFIRKGILARDARPCYYVYMQIMDGRSQTGIFGLNGIDDYKSGAIKKHELTLPQKEEDGSGIFWPAVRIPSRSALIQKQYRTERCLKNKSGALNTTLRAQGISQQLWLSIKGRRRLY